MLRVEINKPKTLVGTEVTVWDGKTMLERYVTTSVEKMLDLIKEDYGNEIEVVDRRKNFQK